MMGSWGKGLNRSGFMLVLIVFVAIAITATGAYSSFSASTGRVFNLTPGTIYLNWTNNYQALVNISNITEITPMNITIRNSTTHVTGNYSQRSAYIPSGDYPNYYTRCLNTNVTRDLPFALINGSGNYSNLIYLSGYPDTTNVTIISPTPCPPGRYWGYLNFSNTTNASAVGDYANLTIILDVPFSATNQLNAATGIGSLAGYMPADPTTYHHYYFNTSNVINATGILINLTWANYTTKDLDLFLLDSSQALKAKSVNRGKTESLYYGRLPENEMWEIRIYGNISVQERYNATIYFTNMNSSQDFNINLAANIFDFGTMVNNNLTTKNITIRNGGSIMQQTVLESMELYRWESFGNITGESSNYSFFVPTYANKLRVSINWTNTNGNFNLTLFDKNLMIMGVSKNKTNTANVTGVEMEEYVVKVNNLTEGIWTVNIKNNTVHVPYNITVKYWVDASQWISSNYSTSTLNISGLSGWTNTFHVNLTIPNRTISGTYAGYLKYKKNNSNEFRIPVKFTVDTGLLLGNNTANNMTVFIDENIGFNTTRIINITLANNGTMNISSIAVINSSSSLKIGSYFVNYTYDNPNWLDPGQIGNLGIILNISQNTTQNVEGVYRGWIFLTANNSGEYRHLNVSLALNLSDEMDIIIDSVLTVKGKKIIENFTENRNVRIKFNVYFQNGTEYTNTINNAINVSVNNFSVWLEGKNGTGYRIPTPGQNLTIAIGAGAIYDATFPGAFYINATIPANWAGSKYFVNLTLHGLRMHKKTFWGKTSYDWVAINRPGLFYIPISSTGFALADNNFTYWNMYVRNYGLTQANGIIGLQSITSGCASITVAAYDGETSSTATARNFTGVNIIANGTELAWYRWKLTAANVTTDISCQLRVVSSLPHLNNQTISISVANADSIPGDGDGDAGGSGDDDDDDDDDTYSYSLDILSFPAKLSAKLGEENSTTISVKNTGDISVGAKVSVSLTGITATIVPNGSQSIPSGGNRSWDITFLVQNDTALGDHTGSFKSYISLKTDVYDTESFIFTVLPTQARINEIAASLLNNSAEFDLVLANFTAIASSGLISAENLSATSLLINDTKAALASISTAIAAGDYATAEALLLEVSSTINRIKSNLINLSQEMTIGEAAAAGGLLTWIIIGIIVAGAIGLFVYMLLPEKSGSGLIGGKYSFRPKHSASITNRLSGPQNTGSKGSPIGGLFKSITGKKKGTLDVAEVSQSENSEPVIKKRSDYGGGGYEKHKAADYKFKKK